MKKIPRLPNLPPPTNVFGKEVPMATWYECPKCLNQSPLTREWVGLTDQEKYDVLEGATGDGGRVYYDTLFRSYEAKLREKNG
jgi:hypothetical protein